MTCVPAGTDRTSARDVPPVSSQRVQMILPHVGEKDDVWTDELLVDETSRVAANTLILEDRCVDRSELPEFPLVFVQSDFFGPLDPVFGPVVYRDRFDPGHLRVRIILPAVEYLV